MRIVKNSRRPFNSPDNNNNRGNGLVQTKTSFAFGCNSRCHNTRRQPAWSAQALQFLGVIKVNGPRVVDVSSWRRLRCDLKYFGILLIFGLLMRCILNGQCTNCSSQPRHLLSGVYCSCHYVRLLSFSICGIRKRARAGQLSLFYGKLCCILSGNDARPAAAHPVHKMALPFHQIHQRFICLPPPKIFAYSSKQNTNFPQQQTNGTKNK